MIDLTTYALLRKQIASVASGISDVRAEGDELVFVLVDGREVKVAIPATEIRDAVVRDDTLVLTLADSQEVVVDATLTKSGQAADAKVTGEAVSQLKGDLSKKLPKSPADWEPWTAEEQAAARERIGIPGDYELIEEIVCDGEVSVYDRKLEPDGTPYAFRSIYVELEIQPSNVYSGVFFRAFDAGGTTVLYDGMNTTNKNYTSYAFAGCYAHSGFYCGWMASTNGAESNSGGSSAMRINKPQIVLSPIKNIHINHNSGVFFDGDKIRIYGVRA